MKRQNIDGRPIYSDEIWEKMQIIGDKLFQLGYKESYRYPNLFYKPFGNNTVYASLQGNEWEPLWENSDLSMNYKGVPYWLFLREIMMIQRAGCPIGDIREHYRFHFNKVPDGLCKMCGKDIISSIPWKQFEKYQLDPKIELCYCDVCKVAIHRQKYLRLKQKQRKKRLNHTCYLCGSIVPQLLNHHITYNPEETIKVCPSCHGLIHKCTFPHYLWKQRRPSKPKGKKVFCRFCYHQHRDDSKIYRSHRLCMIVLDLYYHEVHLKHGLGRLSPDNLELQNKYLEKIAKIKYQWKRVYNHLTPGLQAQLPVHLKKVNNKQNYKNHYILEYI